MSEKQNKAPLKTFAIVAAVVLALLVAVAAGWKFLRKSGPQESVFLVIIDTLPADHVGCYGYERSTTYNIDRLAEEGILYKNAISTAPWTVPSIASILTGVIPYEHKAGIPEKFNWPHTPEKPMSRMSEKVTTMAEMFKEHGFKTVGFFNNPFTDPQFGMDRGFDTYDFASGGQLRIRESQQVVRDAALWLNNNPEGPYFMVLHFFDPHLAYDPTPSFAAPYISDYDGPLSLPYDPDVAAVRMGKAGLTEADKEFVRGAYDGEIAETDRSLGNFINYLKKKGLYDNSFIIVTADHGEELWEHGGFEHGHSLHREVIQVPLVIKTPHQKYAGLEVSDVVSLVDIFPTLADYFKWRPPIGLNGVSLYPAKGGKIWIPPHQVVAMNMLYGPEKHCIYAEGHKLIVTRDTGRIRVYDLEKDPYETQNVFGEEELPEGLKNQVEKIASDLARTLRSGDAEPVNLDKETIDKLKSLGYVTESGDGGTAEK